MQVTANPLSDVEVRPRPVPATVILSAYIGGKVVQFAWAMLLIALVPMWYCVSHESFHPLGYFALLGPTQKVRGVVSGYDVLEKTDMGDGGVKDAFGVEGSHLIREKIPRITYTYTVPNGRSYSAKARVGQDDGRFCDRGVPVTVTYATYNPGASRVEGLSINWASSASFVTIGFWVFLAGSLWLVYPIAHGISRGRRVSRLLQHGGRAHGRFLRGAQRSLFGLYNITDVTHVFEVDGRKFQSTRPRADDLPESLPATETIFYDTTDPTSALALSDIPGCPDLAESGRIQDGATNGYNALCLPLLAALTLFWFVLHMLGIVPPPSLSLLV